MGSILRGFCVYMVLLLVFRIAGKRTLNETTTFDFVLLLIISESIQQAMIDNDNSMTNAFLLVLTLVGLNIGLSVWKQAFRRMDKLVEGLPVVLVADGKIHHERMDKERVDEEDILAAAREAHGLERMDQVKHAVLETAGRISVVPKK